MGVQCKGFELFVIRLERFNTSSQGTKTTGDLGNVIFIPSKFVAPGGLAHASQWKDRNPFGQRLGDDMTLVIDHSIDHKIRWVFRQKEGGNI